MKKTLSPFIVCLALLMLLPVAPTRAVTPPAGQNFDNIVIIAMENQNVCDILTSCGGSATFITSMVSGASYSTGYQGYGASGRTISGCSAGCYASLTSGAQLSTLCSASGSTCANSVVDEYCPPASAPCISITNLFTSLTNARLTYQAYCEYDANDGGSCPRGSDHFPFVAYSNTNPSNCFVAGTCSNIFGGTSP